jgi:ubiquinone/menaquinone biosynthesis C-methylase UbiE
VRLDVEGLPFADASFDGVICESVLGFLGDRTQAVAELGRVVKRGGFLANNEVTFLQPPPEEFRAALVAVSPRSGGVIVVPVEPDGHAKLLEGAGFAPVTVETGDASARQQTQDQMQIDGLRALKPMFASMFDRELRSAVYRRAMAEVQRTFDGCTGYGLYFGRKGG